MGSNTKLIFTILHLAIFAQTFANSLRQNRTDDNGPSPPPEPLDAYKPVKTTFDNVSYVSTISGSKQLNICVGTIIAKRYVVTAADCVNEYKTDTLFVKETLNEAYVRVKDVVFSETYSDKFQLAVLKLVRPLKIPSEPISLISTYDLEKAIKEENNAFTIGYYNTYDPLVAKLKLYPEEQCLENYREMLTEADKYEFNYSLHFCFYPMKNGFVSKFDGSPLVIDGKLAGIKIHNKVHNKNSLYVKINIFEKFLKTVINEKVPTTSTTEPNTTESTTTTTTESNSTSTTESNTTSIAEPTTTTSSNTTIAPEIECEELVKSLEKQIEEAFKRLFITFNETKKNSDLTTNVTSDPVLQQRISFRNAYFQSVLATTLEFQVVVQPIGPKTAVREVLIQHFSNPPFSISITNERLYVKLEADDIIKYQEYFLFTMLNVNVAIFYWNGDISERYEDVYPLDIFDLMFPFLDYFPSFSNPDALLDGSISPNVNINFNVDLNYKK